MSEPFIGEIRMYSMGYAPQGWAQCNGQLLSIQQNQALFSLLGTAFGGDGKTTFALPNLQGRVPTQPVSPSQVGQFGGEETHTLTVNEMPMHSHQAMGAADAPTGTAAGNVWGTGTADNYEVQPNVQMNVNALGTAGANQAHPNMQPYLVLNFCIATVGIFPPRN